MGLFNKKDDKAVAVRENNAIQVPPVTEETVEQYLKAFGLASGLKDHEVQAFKHMATMHNLNPFKREIHCVAYGSGDYRTMSIITGYEVYIAKAEKSGVMEYWDIVEAPPETPLKDYYATLVVKRKDRKTEQRWTAYFSEAAQYKKGGELNSQWRKQPRFMTKKVAMSQGFRLFFEDVMHGMPYTAEEVGGYEAEPRDVSPEPQMVKPKMPEPERQEGEKPPEPKTEHPTDYKKKIMDIVNTKGGLSDTDKINVMMEYRECNTNGSGFEELYHKICDTYGIEK